MYHAGMIPPGGVALPRNAAFLFEPPVPAMEYKPPQPLQGAVIGVFAEPSKRSRPTHALVVNLDYESDQVFEILGRGRLETFDPATRAWSPSKNRRVELKLSPGGGTLVRLRR